MASPEAFPGKKSPFRTGFLKVEMFINSVWTDVTADLSEDGVSITRGRSDESSQPEPSSMSLTLLNTAGKYSPRNPASVYYGQIGRNTPIRVSTTPSAGGTQFFRFWGEVNEWPVEWTVKGVATVTLQCSGVMRRLGQGAAPVKSPVRRGIETVGNLVAYWPVEDGSDASQISIAVGGKPLTIVSGSPSFAAYDGFKGSLPIAMFGTARLQANIPNHTATGETQVRWLSAWPVSTPDFAVICRVRTSGTLNRVDVVYRTGGDVQIEGYIDGGASFATLVTWGLTGLDKVRMSLALQTSGSDVQWAFETYEVGAPLSSTSFGTFTGATMGRVTSVEFNPGGIDLAGMPIGHVTVENVLTTLRDVSTDMLSGYTGERAHDRIDRIGAENGVTVSMTTAQVTAISKLGPQRPGTVLDVMREAASTDGGILFERRTSENIGYRSLEGMWSSTPTATIAYTDNLLRLEPTDDDQSIRNRITATRIGGSSYTHEQTTGANGSAAIGLYDDEVELSLSSDGAAQQQAEWRVHVGAWDETRYPSIGLDLAHPTFLSNTTLRDDILTVDVGHTIKVTGLPNWLPPFPILAIVQGYRETIRPHSWEIEWNTTPAQPMRVAVYGDTSDRYSGEGTVLATSSLNTTVTTFTVTPPTWVKWTSADGPYDIVMAGEQMTVTNVSGNTFTVTRSVNGVVKTHTAGESISLADPCFYKR